LLLSLPVGVCERAACAGVGLSRALDRVRGKQRPALS
jgi:hypothetical protein